ncbi:MAG: hypothetical protein NTW86_20585 [Candidatus Sumerlaeota bacterium]|nr:hypothetical protein [Candidatus Sumerlaeota bacterium]
MWGLLSLQGLHNRPAPARRSGAPPGRPQETDSPIIIQRDPIRLPGRAARRWLCSGRPGSFLAGLLVCFFLASPAAFAVSSAPWARTQFSRRIALTLPAIPVARVNAPVFINLDAYAEPISGTQYELVEQNGATATTVPAIAYAQPDGVCRTLYWKAAGTTAANATRTFYLYFNPGTDVPAWQFRNGMSGTYEEGPDETHSGIVHRPYKLTASRLTLQRCSNAPTDGSAPHMLRGRNSETTEWTVFHELTAPVVSPQSSFLNTWGLADSTEELWEAMLPVESPATDRNGPQVAMSFCLDSSTPIAHRTRVTHRLFDGQVASELVISHAPLGADPVQVTFGTRYLYWKNSAGLDRMTTDAGGDAALPATGSYVDTNRWAIVYRASSGDAIGMLSPRQAQIRVTPKTDYGQINDRWAYSYDGNVLRLIEAVGKRNEILPIFQSLAAGVNADAIETPGFDVTAPTEEQYFLPGDTLNVRIVGSAVDGVTAQLIRPDGSASDIALVDSGPGEVIMNPPMAIGAGTPPGVWTIKAASPQQSLTRTFTVLNLVPGADVWAYPLKTYRREVVLPADPAQARTDAPVFVDLSGVENIDLASVRVDEAAPGARPTPRSAAAYAEPSGEFPRAYWVAAGRTDATVERRFLLYYSKAAGATPYASDWDRAGASFGSKEVRVEGVSGKEDFYVILQGDQLKLQRSAKNMTGVPGDLDHAGFREENPAGSDCNTLTHLASGFSPFDGLRLRYALWGADADVAFTTTTDIQPRPFQSLEFDRNGPTAAFTATYHIDEYKPHTATTTYRVFQAIPLLEFAVDVQTDDGAPVEMAADYYAAREFYWNSAFTPTRMISDVLGDQPVNGDSLVRNWIILYDADQNAFGLFSFRPARLRVNTGKQDLQDLYNTSFRAGESQLYCALGPLANVQTLFAALDRPCRLGPEQLPAFDILSPLPGAHFIPGEDIRIDVAGPSLGADASLRVYFPDGSWRTHAPTTISGPHATFDLGPVAESAQFGAWTLRVTSNGVRRSRGIDVLKPQHPCVLFTPDELAAMRSRWSADPR